MAVFLWIGSGLGALLGLAHGIHVYRGISTRTPDDRRASGKLRAAYYALWTFVLWTLLGFYVLAFWIIGLLAYPVVSLLRGSRGQD